MAQALCADGGRDAGQRTAEMWEILALAPVKNPTVKNPRERHPGVGGNWEADTRLALHPEGCLKVWF